MPCLATLADVADSFHREFSVEFAPGCPVKVNGIPGGSATPDLPYPPKSKTAYRIPDIEKVIFNEESGVTVVLWADDTRTVVRLGKGESFDRYAGFSAAVMKRLFGGTSTAKKVLDSKDEAIIKQKIQQAKEEEQRKLDEKAVVFRQRAQKRKEKRYAELVQYFVDESKAKADADVILKAEAADKSQFIANLSSQIAKEIVRINSGVTLGGVRAPLMGLSDEDLPKVQAVAKEIRKAIEKFC